MFSADEKREQERLRTQRFVGWAVAVSVLLHGALWAASHLIPAPLPSHETIFEVTLSPQPTKAPRLLAAKPHPTPPAKLVRKPQPKRIVPHTEKPRATKHKTTPQRPTQQFAALPKNKPSQRANQAALKESPTSNSFAPNALQPLDHQRSSVSSPSGVPTRNSTPSRAFTGNGLPFSSSPNRANEIASLPVANGTNPTRLTRGGPKRNTDTQVYLPDNQNPAGAGPSGLSNRPRPTGLQNDEGRPVSSNATPDKGRFARGPINGSVPPSFQPDTPRPTPRNEEANDDAPTSQNSTTRKIARRTKGDEPDLFPTPTPQPAPKVIPKPEPQPEPERELFRPAKVRSAPKPEYPADAKAKNQEGVVVVRLQISEAGRVTEAELVSSSGVSSLDEASLRGVRRWTYEPARRGNTAVATSLNARLRWRLTD